MKKRFLIPLAALIFAIVVWAAPFPNVVYDQATKIVTVSGLIMSNLVARVGFTSEGAFTAPSGTITNTLASGTLTEGGNAVPNSTDNLGFFAATTSAQLRGVISDESGGGLAVFNDTPTILTPTIASFVNAQHNHLNAAGGGVLTYAAIPIVPFPATVLTVSGTNYTADASTASKFVVANPSANFGLIITNGSTWQEISIGIRQDSTGSRLVSMLGTNWIYGSDITGITLTTNAGYWDWLRIYCISNTYQVVGFVRGYTAP